MPDSHFNGPLAHLLRAAIRSSPPDPWPEEVDAEVRGREAVPLCTSCLCPQNAAHWFCPHCGFPSGSYTVTMPYMNALIDGEFFRRGVSGPPEPGAGRQLFLALYSAAAYNIFAPVYWFWLYRKAQGRPLMPSCRREYDPTADSSEAELGIS